MEPVGLVVLVLVVVRMVHVLWGGAKGRLTYRDKGRLT